MSGGGRRTVSVREAAQLTGVSRRTVYCWLKAGRVEYVRTAGGSVRIVEDTLWDGPPRREWSPERRSA